ncbi:iron-sulfur cluster assembly protein [uncultured Tenacibaculum sp.]|uniref:iron-sulfur cluster assembly protein n=1 Tax=uncultured Tenacibaculum sp. TaxID=174713 RepID=UPI0026055B8E|nr:iron-sulfur cluster assembly protein [uncultured Tenacibaculum sp.]
MEINKQLQNEIIKKIKEVFDPEIPVDVYELGLIYDVIIHENNSVHVSMTLTSPSCPVAKTLPHQVKRKIEELKLINKVEVELTWQPNWNRSMISEEAKLTLGIL